MKSCTASARHCDPHLSDTGDLRLSGCDRQTDNRQTEGRKDGQKCYTLRSVPLTHPVDMVGRDDMSMELGLVSRHDVGGPEGVGVRAPLPSPPAGEGGELNILVLTCIPACGHRFLAAYARFWKL